MTATNPLEFTIPVATSPERPARRAAVAATPQRLKFKLRDWFTLLGLSLGTAALYFWNLTANGWANSFYSAAVQAGSVSWKAFFYGSFDASNAITVDKPPAALWLMELSVRLFGLSSFSILLPEVLLGVASVAALFLLLRRQFGLLAGLIGGLTLALTPVAALMFRFNNPDALLALLMILSVGATFRLNATQHKRWALVIGALLGVAFLTKSFQAFLILPALALPYLIFGQPKLGRRFLDLGLALMSMVLAGGWWVAIVELVPASARPYIGGSQTNSALELIFGYNGFGRLTGNETGSVGGGRGGTGGMWGATGITRLFTGDFGGQIAWLLPLALVAVALGVLAHFKTRRADQRFFQTLVWGGALLATGLTFSFMAGIFHQYYTVALAPYIAALSGIFAATLWHLRARLWVRIVGSTAVLGSAIWAAVLLGRNAEQSWLIPFVIVVGALAAAALQFLHVNKLPVRAAAGALTCVALLAGPTYYTLYTIASAHSGSIVTAGPAVSGSTGGPGGMGNRGGGPGGGNFGGQMGNRQGTPPQGAPNGQNGAGATSQQGGPGGTFGGQPGTSTRGGTQTGNRQGGPGGGTGARGAGGVGGLLNASTPSAALTALLKQDASKYTWVLAVSGSQQAAGYQLATQEPVMSMGGFNGSDPYPSLAQFQKLVSQGKIHYYIASGTGGQGMGTSGNATSAISTWVAAHYKTVKVGSTTLYDLTAAK